jgi:signal peptidase I
MPVSARRRSATDPTTNHQRFRSAVSGLLLVLAVCALAWCGVETGTGRWHATPVLSGSMRPGLQPGDVVVTQRVPVSDLRVRDVIVFHPPGETQGQTVHRIVRLRVKRGTTYITTRGDANSVNDPEVTGLRGQTAYRVTRVVPLVGYPAVWLSGDHHGLLAIGLGVMLLVVAGIVVLRPGDSENAAGVHVPSHRDEHASPDASVEEAVRAETDAASVSVPAGPIERIPSP